MNEQDILVYETESDPETDLNESDDDYLPDCDSELDHTHISASDYDSESENNVPQTFCSLNSKLLRCYSIISEGKNVLATGEYLVFNNIIAALQVHKMKSKKIITKLTIVVLVAMVIAVLLQLSVLTSSQIRIREFYNLLKVSNLMKENGLSH